ncbi:hypothetical protein MHA01_00830 [Marinococcus halophilus]|uniref:Uncharacterized protein n=1 Tax=Marinococcus halophilus TaxID=1371 RepID=A0A510Y1J0_MARHA|nr:hypothetical protein MHA01_00830 [Marinococcus halophilus]
MFRNWFCPDCKSHLRRIGGVKYKSKLMGHYTLYWHMCLNCGSSNAIPFKTYLKQKATEGVL